MADPGIVRARAKIEATIAGARIFCEMRDRGEDFADYLLVVHRRRGGQGRRRQPAAKTPLSETISKELKRRGFKFVGPTIVYAWMQAVGIVNDHAAGCFRRTFLMIAPLGTADIPALVALWEACGLTRPWNDPERDARLAIEGATSAILGLLDGGR